MKCLSLWQPWASMVQFGAKRYETRSWATPYRGLLAIHAAKKWTGELSRTCGRSPFSDVLRSYGMYTDGTGLPLGSILSVHRLIDCRPAEEVYPEISEQERDFGNYADGRFAWQLERVQVLDKPIPYRGLQQLFEVPLVLRAGNFVIDADAQPPAPAQLELLK